MAPAFHHDACDDGRSNSYHDVQFERQMVGGQGHNGGGNCGSHAGTVFDHVKRDSQQRERARKA